jgi:hypothetical protein
VLSVHSVVSFDFAVSQVPGWHTTIFPPYFVAGAIFSGFAMVVTLMIPARQWFGLKDFITLRHLENMNKIILATGTAWSATPTRSSSSSPGTAATPTSVRLRQPRVRPYAWAYWTMVSCNVICRSSSGSRSLRTTPRMMFIIDLRQHRHVVRALRDHVTSLSRDFLPSSWGYFTPTWVDVGMTFVGSFGLFFTLFLLFCRFLPMVAMAEVKTAKTFPEKDGDGNPLRMTMAFLERGRERYEIFCSSCHGLGVGGVTAGGGQLMGNGIVDQRATELEQPLWIPPTSFHTDEVRGRAVGHLYNSIANGIRSMPSYGSQIPPRDRWAIVAYLRALQRSQRGRIEDVPPELREGLR